MWIASAGGASCFTFAFYIVLRDKTESVGHVMVVHPGDNLPAMSRDRAIAHAERYFDEGGFFADLARRVAIPTESQNPDRVADLARYLSAEMQPSFERLGFKCRLLENPLAKGGPFLFAVSIPGR